MRFDLIKIDRMLTTGAMDDTLYRAAIESIVYVGARLGLHIVAVGVQQQQVVRNAGADLVQAICICGRSRSRLLEWLQTILAAHTLSASKIRFARPAARASPRGHAFRTSRPTGLAGP